ARSRDRLGEFVGSGPAYRRLSWQAPDPRRESEPGAAVHLHQRTMERPGLQASRTVARLCGVAEDAAGRPLHLVRAGRA
ncbi:hypothetical protein QU38_00330, partial [Staphylococcus aureus]